MGKKLLIISNNVISTTNNNGKTIFSFFDSLSFEDVGQLYFSSEIPSISGYKYFRISDEDVIRGRFNKKNRGKSVEILSNSSSGEEKLRIRKAIKKNDATRCLRELMWINGWRSQQLVDWLDDFHPDSVFFVAGDSIFAYVICRFIVNRYDAKLSVYITDDYILPSESRDIFKRIRKKYIIKELKKDLSIADNFYTVSPIMREVYRDYLGKDSKVIVNLTDSLLVDNYQRHNSIIKLIYAGSVYYGRDDTIAEIAKAIDDYNKTSSMKAKLFVYTNDRLPEKVVRKITVADSSEYCGSLNKDDLIKELNSSDILVFVESFEKCYVEKVRLSLSTKVPEYLSLRKPILAVGPSNIGSIDYIKDSAFCISSQMAIKDGIKTLLSSDVLRYDYGKKALCQFNRNHNKSSIQESLIKEIF